MPAMWTRLSQVPILGLRVVQVNMTLVVALVAVVTDNGDAPVGRVSRGEVTSVWRPCAVYGHGEVVEDGDDITDAEEDEDEDGVRAQLVILHQQAQDGVHVSHHDDDGYVVLTNVVI